MNLCKLRLNLIIPFLLILVSCKHGTNATGEAAVKGVNSSEYVNALIAIGYDEDMASRIALHLPEKYLKKFVEERNDVKTWFYYRGLQFTRIRDYDPTYVGNQGQLFFSPDERYALGYSKGAPGEQDQGIILKFVFPYLKYKYNGQLVRKFERTEFPRSFYMGLAADYAFIIPDDRMFLHSIGFVKSRELEKIDWVPYQEAVERGLIKAYK